MSETIIEAKNLTKKYGNFIAVKNLNLTVKKGEIFGLLGPNGAGKTTTILMLLGLTEPTSGKVNMLGFDPTRQPLKIKSKAGYIPESVGFYDELSAKENLIYIAKLNGIPRSEAQHRINQALEKVNLIKVADQRVGTFSRGMRQRLGVADVLIKEPQLIIMDEPTQGLDPESARQFLTLIRTLANTGITILISSHLLHQVQQVCDRVGLFHRGRMVLEGTVEELAKQIFGGEYHIRLNANGGDKDLVEELQQLDDVVEVRFEKPDSYSIIASSDLRSHAAQAVIQSGGHLTSLGMTEFNLEDIYNSYFEEVNHGPRKE